MAAERSGRGRRALEWLRRYSANALFAGVVVALVTGGVTFAVNELSDEDPPPGCPGGACDGRSPADEGCDSDAGTYRPTAGNPAALEIRYSPRCEAAWARITRGDPGDQVRVEAGARQRDNVIHYDHDQYTRMVAVADPHDFRLRACAVPAPGGKGTGDWERYCIQATETTHFR